MCISKLGHELPIFKIPDSNKAAIIGGDNTFECTIVECKGDGELMRRLDLFLGFEEPLVDLSRAEQDVVCVWVELKCSKAIFRTIALLVKDGLDTQICARVPNFDALVGAE